MTLAPRKHSPYSTRLNLQKMVYDADLPLLQNLGHEVLRNTS
jgi:hypothetical protein